MACVLPPDRSVTTVPPAPGSPTTAPAPWTDVSSAGTPTASAPPGSSASATRVARYSGFRPEVQGLRAVAVLLVVIYHVFMGRVSGGVDIFLLISAFFMTLSFVRRIEGGRPLGLARYWLHTFKRLLPLATVIILGTLALVAFVFPRTDVAEFRSQGVASILYVENWALAANQVDYYAADHSTASPFQHFWSLSVQGQVFLVWPLIFALAWFVKRRTGRSCVPVLAGCFGLVFVASLAFSVVTTASRQEFAYFDTRARLWEFALGSLLALAVPYLRVGRGLGVLLGWAGFVSMVLVGILVDVQGAFPGWIALWPLLSAAAIIVAGQTGSPIGFDRFLSWGPVVRLGDAAYALYLVHWPLLISYLVLRERPEAGPRSGVALVVLSVVLALALTRWVEAPMKRWAWPEARKWRMGLVIAVCMGLVVAAAGAWSAVERHRTQQLTWNATENNPGAVSLLPGFQFAGDPEAPTLPLPEDLSRSAAELGGACPEDIQLPEQFRQFCHETRAAENPAETVLVTGNSHAQHWLPAITALAEANNWRVVNYIQPGCYYTVAEEQPPFETCDRWFEGTQPMVDAVHPGLMFVQGTFTNVDGEFWKAGLETRVRDLVSQGIDVVGIRDVPRFSQPPSECAVENGEDAPQCVGTHPMLGTEDPQQTLADVLPGFSAVDMTDVICPREQCRPVIGNVYVYLDDDHITGMYSATTAPIFAQRTAEAMTADGGAGLDVPR
ncbi:acyltransferase family protein [Kocuria indica]|uniref:Acyltransferase family protein n=1 Tax=Kocuria marina subsp. indica TaxID=1049583 RepID=A0A6N9QWW7_9MICC|nr:acyltransferase family protein [Kocuria indica]